MVEETAEVETSEEEKKAAEQEAAKVEAEKKEAAEADKAFAEGFSGVSTPEPTVEKPPVSEEPAPEPEPTPEPEPEAPKVYPLTEAQYNDLAAKAKTVDDLKALVERQFGSAFGKLGGLERTIKQIQEATPAGQPVTVTDEDLAELRAEFPDLTSNLVKGLSRVMGKLKGTGSSIPSLTPEQMIQHVRPVVDEAVAAAKTEVLRANQVEWLNDFHPDWMEVTGPEGSDTAYRKWLNAQDAAYKTKIEASWNAREIAESIDLFKEAQKKTTKPAPKPAGSVRMQRLAEAVPPQGTPGPVKKRALTEDEEFEAGFKAGR